MGKVKTFAWLVFPDWMKTRRKNGSFDGVSNIGAYMLNDVAERNGIHIGFCSVDSAREYDTVLVSLTSNYDMLAFYKAVRLHPDWQKPRRFRVLMGGFGLQNPFLVVDYVDAFWFGRCEDEWVNVLTIEDYEHESLMRPDRPKVCKIHQVDRLYPHQFKLYTGISGHDNFTEKIMGCPNKCFFCHFSFCRKHIKTSDHYNLNEYNKGSQELDMFNIEDLDYSVGKITIGLDGLSERLRFLVNKPIKDDLLRETVVRISQNTTIKGEAVFLTLYNITGYETETDEDFYHFRDIMAELPPKLKKRMIVTLHTTPLHPSPATPLAFAPVNIHTQLENLRGSVIFTDDFRDKHNRLLLLHSRYNASNWSLLESVAVERFSEQYRKLVDMICFNKKFNAMKAAEKIDYCERHFDLGDLLRRYETTEQVPSWVCESYFGWDTIRKMRDFMVNKINKYENGKG